MIEEEAPWVPLQGEVPELETLQEASILVPRQRKALEPASHWRGSIKVRANNSTRAEDLLDHLKQKKTQRSLPLDDLRNGLNA